MKISFLCGSGGPSYEWCDPHYEEGIGGSEEQLIGLARALARLGHRVQVFNRCGSLAGIYNGVTWIPEIVRPYPAEDVVIAWRNWHLLEDISARRKVAWSHDQPIGCHAPSTEELTTALGTVDLWVLLNPYHSGLYSMIPQDKKTIIPIGVNLEDFGGGVERIRGRVLYFSEPARGLNILRGIWKEIRWRVPHATLASFWWDESKFYDPDESLGILPMAHLGPRQAAEECQRASVFGYPCLFDEISPATALKAQIGGAVPCVVPRGGLDFVTKFGVKTDYQHFAKELCDLLVDEDRQEKIRKEMVETMRLYSSWDAIAAMWVKEMERHF